MHRNIGLLESDGFEQTCEICASVPDITSEEMDCMKTEWTLLRSRTLKLKETHSQIGVKFTSAEIGGEIQKMTQI